MNDLSNGMSAGIGAASTTIMVGTAMPGLVAPRCTWL